MQDELDKSLATTSVKFGALGEIHQLCVANPKRRALIISSAGSLGNISTNQNDLLASSQPGGVASGTVAASSPPLVLNRRDHGALCTSAWFAGITGAQEQFWVAEAVDP